MIEDKKKKPEASSNDDFNDTSVSYRIVTKEMKQEKKEEK